eukprot:12202175-Ditylum_brightwellii.AAC.1
MERQRGKNNRPHLFNLNHHSPHLLVLFRQGGPELDLGTEKKEEDCHEQVENGRHGGWIKKEEYKNHSYGREEFDSGYS